MWCSRNGAGQLAGSWDGTSLCLQGDPNAVGGESHNDRWCWVVQDWSMQEPVAARSQEHPDTRH